MLIEQNFELRGPGPPGRVCTPIAGCFHDKTIISNKNIRLDCYLLLKNCRWQCTLLPRTLVKSLTKFNPKMQHFSTCFGLKLQAEGGLNNLLFAIGFQILKI